ncbi:Arc family DNA-binding protein [Anaerotignum sp.]
MSASEAQKRATAKWQKEKVEEIKFRVPKGRREVIKAHADSCGESMNAFLVRAVTEAMERDVMKNNE